jgi:hypothetical protein
MGRAKDIHVAPVAAKDANRLVKRIHYSGKVVSNSQLHLGVWLDGRLEGAMQFGPSLDKRKMLGLVRGTEWNGFLELNRMAFSDRLPRNSESRALGFALRLIRKRYPHVEWVVSFADATQCGDGAIYRASGFVLTALRKNTDLVRLADGTVTHTLSQKTGRDRLKLYARTGGASRAEGERLTGWQLRYLFFTNPAARDRLVAEVIPFEEITARGAGMYRGRRK